MNLLKDFTLKWWQVSAFKLSMFAFGVAFAITWPQWFASWVSVIWVIAIVLALYLMYVWFKQ